MEILEIFEEVRKEDEVIGQELLWLDRKQKEALIDYKKEEDTVKKKILKGAIQEIIREKLIFIRERLFLINEVKSKLRILAKSKTSDGDIKIKVIIRRNEDSFESLLERYDKDFEDLEKMKEWALCQIAQILKDAGDEEMLNYQKRLIANMIIPFMLNIEKAERTREQYFKLLLSI